MRVVIAGGTGFLGRMMTTHLTARGHRVVVLTRRPPGGPGPIDYVSWRPDGEAGEWAAVVDGADAVVNLAGEGLADRRWSEDRKRLLRSSRVLATRSLVAALRRASRTPGVFVSSSAVGYYGDTGDSALDESSPPGSDFLATLCVDWEAEAHPVAALGSRLVVIRTGIVLAGRGGVLQRMKLPFQLFIGGPLGSGRQFMSWIHRDDWLGFVLWALQERNAEGVFNVTAPQPVTNGDFAHALGRALHRPSWLPAPGFALRAVVGEIADVALLGGQRVLPRRALDAGFIFRHPQIDEAMQSVVATAGAAGATTPA